ncbi:TM2 domain-containing protein [Agromyces sp. C10]|uniref:TM2 domain-containing protein n=1 Tax=Agromyces sp. C10 TaxID=2935077 RepID=UPI002009EBF6|nr:TM2 domain-containing protein [Agromyces sp. C10]MCK8610625.1 TM2 domain-containing protein [Agromyces sp. C10]
MTVDPSGTPGYVNPQVARAAAESSSSRSFIATWLFAWLLGVLGVDRFYLGKVGTGILKLLTIGGFGIWWLIDLILTLANAQRDADGRRVVGTRQEQAIGWIVTAVGVLLGWVLSAMTQAFAVLTDQLPGVS